MGVPERFIIDGLAETGGSKIGVTAYYIPFLDRPVSLQLGPLDLAAAVAAAVVVVAVPVLDVAHDDCGGHDGLGGRRRRRRTKHHRRRRRRRRWGLQNEKY